MKTPGKYRAIISESQYDRYCERLEELLDLGKKNTTIKNEIEQLSLLIEKWDEKHNNVFNEPDPIELLKYLMKENGLKQKDIVDILGVSKGLISSILSYRRGLSKDSIRILAQRFKVNQEAFNRSYQLVDNKKATSKTKAGTTKTYPNYPHWQKPDKGVAVHA